MPNYLLPRNQGAHRIAAVSLFRTLLAQCRALLALEAPQRHELQNIIRNRFKQARHISGQKLLRYQFEAGYEAVDCLDAAAAGEHQARLRLLQLLENVPVKVKQDPPVLIPKRLRKTIRKRDRERNGPLEAEPVVKPSIFDRPLPLEQLSGRRKVPALFNAQGLPVLRIKKPQPQSLSGYIADKLSQRQKRHDLRHRLDEELNMARMEDEWDRIVDQQFGERGTCSKDAGGHLFQRQFFGQQEPRWSGEFLRASRNLADQLKVQRERNIEIRDKMMEVVAKERELYEKEKAERTAEGRSKWLRQCGRVDRRADAS
ncbi:putative complex I LYR family protein [Teratosphaeria destructans]|uniref:Complex I LYR family protein n=1 Tax=Teratosphaeria destructans TaxID=418781 RepID=A0A9W7W6G4_9PEZI|nr:putative complex I LYR family protein [Teratosphaeria destructans]